MKVVNPQRVSDFLVYVPQLFVFSGEHFGNIFRYIPTQFFIGKAPKYMELLPNNMQIKMSSALVFIFI